MPSDEEGVVKNVDIPAGDVKLLASEAETGMDDELARLLKQEQEEREKAKKQELCKALERVQLLQEENTKLETQLSLQERQTDRKFTSVATGSDGRPDYRQNGIAYSKSVIEDINAVHNLISDQFKLPACMPGGAGARGWLDTMQGIFGKGSDTESESEFSLACRDHRGKHRKSRQDSLKDKHSGIKDKCSEVVVNKQLYPHATLQQEFLWGWDGNDIEYKDLTFGLSVTGELEIILSDLTNKQECRQMLDILRLTAYHSVCQMAKTSLTCSNHT